jgi:hypothetical protein
VTFVVRFVVEDTVLVEVKALDAGADVHTRQIQE